MRTSSLFEFLCWAFVAFGAFFALLASSGCADSPSWRPRDFCAAVRDDWCSEWCNRDTELCRERVYRGCQREVEGLVPHDEAWECLQDIADQSCIYTDLPESCPDWAD